MHGVRRQYREIVRSGIMLLGIEAMRILEMGMGKSKLLRLGIHQHDKAGLRSAHMLGDGCRRVVARAKHQPVQHILQRHLFALLKKERRAFLGISVPADRHLAA
ncbi:hypothetical protein D3C71_1663450 [compost metagenome]